MKPIQHLRRAAAALAGLACAGLALVVAAPAAFAMIPGDGGAGGTAGPVTVPAVTPTVVVGGMPGWQIALIAVGAALLAATLAVLADRARTARRQLAAAAA
jgi:hypothetical protein